MSEIGGPDEPDQRWPRSVYGAGSEPDPRFSLANERTFLAWIRTTIALLAGAAAVDALDVVVGQPARSLLALLLAVSALACALMAWRGWCRTERALRLRRPLPHSPAQALVVVCLVVVAMVLVVATAFDGY